MDWVTWNRTLHDVTSQAREAYTRPDPLITSQVVPRRPVKGSVSGFKLLPKALQPVDLLPKFPFVFEEYATPFEKYYSAVIHDRGLAPVVSPQETPYGFEVIGHYGRVTLGGIFIPKRHPNYRSLSREILPNGIPAFVVPGPERDAAERNGWKAIGETEVYSMVLTSVTGMVMAELGGGIIGLEPVAITPLDLILIPKLIVDLGALAGRKLISTMARKEAVDIAAKGVTRELAMEATALEAAAAREAQAASHFLPESGMTRAHFEAFRQAARETESIAIVRNTNTASTRWIERGFPGKPLTIKINTSKETGIVTAKNAEEMGKAQLEGFFVVGEDRVARRVFFGNGKRELQEMKLDKADWPVEKGQIIDPVTKKPLVGDYDLMGVAPVSSPGRNIHLVPQQELQQLGRANYSGPDVERFRSAVNAKLDRPRVMHGAQDQYSGKGMPTGFEKSGPATVFFPNGTVKALGTEAEVKQFYDTLGRATAKGHYPQPAGVPYPADELAARRAARQGR